MRLDEFLFNRRIGPREFVLWAGANPDDWLKVCASCGEEFICCPESRKYRKRCKKCRLENKPSAEIAAWKAADTVSH